MNQVDNLLANDFQSCSHEEKLQIKHIGAHRPLDVNITQPVGYCKFNNEWFGRNQWLTASIGRQSLACYSVEWVCCPGLCLRVSFPRLTFKIKHSHATPWARKVYIHWPYCQFSMSSAAFKTTGNSDFGKYPTQNSKSGTLVSF
jgi:hypothetical protein